MSVINIIEVILRLLIPAQVCSRDVAWASILPAHVFVDSDLVVDVQVVFNVVILIVLLLNLSLEITAIFDQVFFAGGSPSDGYASKDE